MKRLTCEMCGSTDLIKQDGVFVCQTCGCKYSIEEAKKMMLEGTVEVKGTVKIDQTETLKNSLLMAQNSSKAQNYKEAEKYANRVIEIAPQNAEAWEIKGTAAAWQSTAANNRLPEAVIAWKKAMDFSNSKKEKVRLKNEIRKECGKVFVAIVNLNILNFKKIESKSTYELLIQNIFLGINAINELTFTTAVSFSDKAMLFNDVARKLLGVASATKPEYRLTERNTEWYCAVMILEIAADLACENDLKEKIVRTLDAMHYGKKRLEEFEELYTDDRISSQLQYFENLSARNEIEEGKRQYWREHSEEKQNLEQELSQLSSNLETVRENITNTQSAEKLKNAVKERDDYKNKISNTQNDYKKLGLFQGKQKKELRLQIEKYETHLNELSSVISEIEGVIEIEKAPLLKKETAALSRIAEINEELSKERGKISTVDSDKTYSSVENGKFTITADEFYDRLSQQVQFPLELTEMETSRFAVICGIELQSTEMHLLMCSVKNSQKNFGDIHIYVGANRSTNVIEFIFIEFPLHLRRRIDDDNFEIPVGGAVLQALSNASQPSAQEEVFLSFYAPELSGFVPSHSGIMWNSILYNRPLGEIYPKSIAATPPSMIFRRGLLLKAY